MCDSCVSHNIYGCISAFQTSVNQLQNMVNNQAETVNLERLSSGYQQSSKVLRTLLHIFNANNFSAGEIEQKWWFNWGINVLLIFLMLVLLTRFEQMEHCIVGESLYKKGDFVANG